MPLINTGKLSLHTQVLGEGPLVVMTHGLLMGSLATWYFTAAPVLAKRHRVLLYDLRGHGRSDRASAGYDLATMTGDLAALLRRTDSTAAPLDLVGHSYGGLVALRYALDHPGNVRRLALVDVPLPPSFPQEAFDLVASRPTSDLLEALPDPQREAILGGGRRARRLLDRFQFLATQTSLLDDLRTEADIPDEVLRQITCPVLCVYGEASSFGPAGERLARILRDARLVYLPGGHYVPIEAPAPLTHLLVEFLDG